MKKRAFVYFIVLIVVGLIASSLFVFLSGQHVFNNDPKIMQEVKDSLLGYFIIGSLVGLPVSYILAVRLTSTTIKPLKQLIAFLNEISKGNYDRRISLDSPDEMGQLADSFNMMASILDSTITDLKEQNIKFDSVMSSMTNGILAVDNNCNIILLNPAACKFLSIDDAKGAIGKKFIFFVRNHHINQLIDHSIKTNSSSATEINMGIQNEMTFKLYANPIKSSVNENSNSGSLLTMVDVTNLKRLERVRSDFVSNVTHELKTPLTSIRGFVETLRSGMVEDQEVADNFLHIIDIEAERLSTLINEILHLSEIETRNEDVNLNSNNIFDIIQETVAILSESADKKGVKINIDCERDVEIYANGDRIKQLFINLIDNAIKYNVDSGEVFVEVSKACNKASNNIYINIRDTGIGIASNHLNRLFERFYRVDQGRSRNTGGTGLGLSIVKHIVNLYKGDIKVYSQPDNGTEFKIRIPFN